MTVIQIATVVALGLNLVALLVVAHQTRLTRKSLRAANRSIELSIKTMQVDLLPQAGWVINVRVKLEMWMDDLADVIDRCQYAIRGHDDSLLKEIAEGGIARPEGLLHNSFKEYAHAWLQNIITAGVQYYFNAKCVQSYVWDKSEEAPNYDFAPSLVQVCADSRRALGELLTLVDDVVPAVYMNAPASIDDDRFFRERSG